MINLTLKQLRAIETLARLGHFGQAAAACTISQPALSMQISAAEAVLGGALFERGPRHVRPTPLGVVVVERAHKILRDMDDLAELAAVARRGMAGRLRLGVIPTVAPYLLPRIMAALSRDFSDLDVNVRETTTPNLLEDLSQGRLDTAIVALPVADPQFTFAPLLTENFVLIRPASEATKPVPSPAMLREMRLLLLEEGHCFRDQALAFCALRPATPRETLDGSSLMTLVQMVGAGMGVTLIPEMAVPVETRLADVAVSRFPPPEPSRKLGMIWRRSSPLHASFDQITTTLRRAIA